MWPKFGNSSISITEFAITSILLGFDQENQLFRSPLPPSARSLLIPPPRKNPPPNRLSFCIEGNIHNFH